MQALYKFIYNFSIRLWKRTWWGSFGVLAFFPFSFMQSSSWERVEAEAFFELACPSFSIFCSVDSGDGLLSRFASEGGGSADAAVGCCVRRLLKQFLMLFCCLQSICKKERTNGNTKSKEWAMRWINYSSNRKFACSRHASIIHIYIQFLNLITKTYLMRMPWACPDRSLGILLVLVHAVILLRTTLSGSWSIFRARLLALFHLLLRWLWRRFAFALRIRRRRMSRCSRRLLRQTIAGAIALAVQLFAKYL